MEELWINKSVVIPRRTTADNHSNYELHAFVDASMNAYACGIYLRSSCRNVSYMNLLFAKSRLRPKKSAMTIPRLELMAMVVGLRALKMVKK
jgi:uncharacterized protein (DUF1810 family)